MRVLRSRRSAIPLTEGTLTRYVSGINAPSELHLSRKRIQEKPGIKIQETRKYFKQMKYFSRFRTIF